MYITMEKRRSRDYFGISGNDAKKKKKKNKRGVIFCMFGLLGFYFSTQYPNFRKEEVLSNLVCFVSFRFIFYCLVFWAGIFGFGFGLG